MYLLAIDQGQHQFSPPFPHGHHTEELISIAISTLIVFGHRPHLFYRYCKIYIKCIKQGQTLPGREDSDVRDWSDAFFQSYLQKVFLEVELKPCRQFIDTVLVFGLADDLLDGGCVLK
jgi:hypothetical protein